MWILRYNRATLAAIAIEVGIAATRLLIISVVLVTCMRPPKRPEGAE